MPVLKRIISGGQTGADRGGLEVAIALGIPHAGWCPKGRRAEDGAIPAQFVLQETKAGSYSERTERNVLEADGTVVFTIGKPTGGSALTIALARKHRKPWIHVDVDSDPTEEAAGILRKWIGENRIETLNIAGSRESKAPGIAARVRRILTLALAGT